MWLKKVRLRNVGPHADLAVELEQGSVALCGSNGAGKSTFLSAVLGCLANDWSRFRDGKAGARNDLAPPDEEAFVECTFVHDDVEFRVRRDLGGGHLLEVPSEGLTLTKDGEIRKHLEKLLGVDAFALANYVFVRQRQMAGWLDQPAGKRAEAFHRSCGTQIAAEGFEAAGRLSERFSADPVAVEDATALSYQLGEVRAELAKVYGEEDRLNALLLPDEDVAKAEALVRDAGVRAALLEQAAGERARLEALEGEVRELRAARDSCEGAAARLSVAYDAAAAAAGDADAGLAAWDRYDRARARLSRAEARRISISDEAGDNPEPPAPPRPLEDLDDLKAELARRKAEVRDQREVLRVFDEEGQVACPTCHTKVSDLAGYLAGVRASVAAAPAELLRLQAEVSGLEACRKAHAEWQRWRSGWSARLAEAEHQVESAGADAGPPPDADRETLGRLVRARDGAAAECGEARKALNAAEARLRAAEAARDAVAATVAGAEARLAATPDNPKRLAKARRYLGEHRQAEVELAALDERCNSLRGREADLSGRLKRARELAEAAGARAEVAGLLRRLRDEVLHHSKLPRLVARGNLEKMEDAINGELENFGSPFWVETGEDLGFVVHFPGAPPRPAEELSGGQQMVFSFAYRPVHASLLGADVGMLALDEPTDGLDATNVAYLRDALQKLAGRIRGRRQVIVVTHHEALLPAFDQVVRFGEPA